MIPLAAIGAIAGTAFNAFNALNSARAAKKAQRAAMKELDNSAALKRNYYNRELYKNYFDGADAKNAIRSLNENIDRQRSVSDGVAAVTGATPEASLAAGAARGKAISDAHASIAGQGERYKSGIARAYADMEEQYSQAKANILNQKAAGHSAAMGNALGGMAHSALGLAGELMPVGSGLSRGVYDNIKGSVPKVDAPDANLDFLKEIPTV